MVEEEQVEGHLESSLERSQLNSDEIRQTQELSLKAGLSVPTCLQIVPKTVPV